MEIRSIDRTKTARSRRYQEYLGLKLLPYRSKEQEGRFQWLKKQREFDNRVAMTEAK